LAIGEGTETQEQKNILKAVGCDMAQGYYYYYSKPLPESEFIEFVLINRAWERDICICS
jgi:sensor c-di-GMP phosphodiesterase-like protein